MIKYKEKGLLFYQNEEKCCLNYTILNPICNQENHNFS